MPTTRKLFKNALEQAINKNGFTIVFEGDDDYYLVQKDVESESISMQLILPNKVDISENNIDGNETVTQSIFKLNIPVGQEYPDYFVMALENAFTDSADFIIISSVTLNEKLFNLGLSWKRKVELCFLQYPDGKVFNVTDISFEGRWYLLSKGVGGRMADRSVYDYSDWLNNWDVLN